MQVCNYDYKTKMDIRFGDLASNLSVPGYLALAQQKVTEYRKSGNFRCRNIFVVAEEYEN